MSQFRVFGNLCSTHFEQICHVIDSHIDNAMANITDPVIHWALAALLCVVAGTFLLITVAVFRRWAQIRFLRYVHALRREFRPLVAKALAGGATAGEIAALSELSLADLEMLLDPVFSKRKLPERCLRALQGLCAELGLIRLWESRAANGRAAAGRSSESAPGENGAERTSLCHLLRAKSIRNLGTLRHRSSWPLLIDALDDRHVDIQLVALRSLAAMGAPESFPVLNERLQSVVQGTASSPPRQGLQAAMAGFGLDCAAGLMPSLLHPNRSVRFAGAEILRTMVYRHAAQNPEFTLNPGLISPALVELLLSGLAKDSNSDVRARAAELMIFLTDSRTASVMRNLLEDSQWFVRMRAVRALARLGPAAAPFYAGIRGCLRDPHWRVREAAIHAFLSLGSEGARQVFDHFLRTPEGAVREQILEIVERAGLTAALADAYEAAGGNSDNVPVEPRNGNAALPELPRTGTKPQPVIAAEFLHRVIPGGEARNSPPEASRKEKKGASRRQRGPDGTPYPSV